MGTLYIDLSQVQVQAPSTPYCNCYTEMRMFGYWHHAVFCPSIGPSACLSVCLPISNAVHLWRSW